MMTTVELDARLIQSVLRMVWTNELLIPTYLCVLSLALFTLQILWGLPFVRRLRRVELADTQSEQIDVDEEHRDGSYGFFKNMAIRQGGTAILIWKLLRLLGCLVLAGIATVIAMQGNNDVEVFVNRISSSNQDALLVSPGHPTADANTRTVRWTLLAVFMYSSGLAAVSLLGTTIRERATRHLSILGFATFCIYAYRDLWPIATYTQMPMDLEEGRLLWAKVAVLTFVAVVVPLLTPRRYIPLDPKNPQEEPNNEQTASLLSFFTFSFLDSVVFLAYRTPHLPYDKLPPLCDYDRTEQLVKRSFKLLDTYQQEKPRYVLWNLLELFWKEYAQLALMLVIKALSGFLAPLTVNQLLNYVETGGKDASVRPWVWILAMLLGPIIGSSAFQYYIFITTRSLVCVEGIITQLVFEHSLRLRILETRESNSKPGSSTAPLPTTDIGASGGVEVNNEARENGHGIKAISRHAKSAYFSWSPAILRKCVEWKSSLVRLFRSPTPLSRSSHSGQASNVVGRINNLVTIDTQNIIGGRDFLFIILYVPLELCLCVWFLWRILEWSAFVGIATLVICFPLPGYVAKLVSNVQRERLKRTDARTQGVTEVMSVIRMIKLFAWETKIQEQMIGKREAELKWIKRRQLLQLTNRVLNYFLPLLCLLTTYGSYTLVFRHKLTASRVFSSMTVFDMLRSELTMFFYQLPACIQAKVSLDRVDEFLRHSTLLDSFKAQTPSKSNEISPDSETISDEIGFHSCMFSWDDDESEVGRLSTRTFRLRIDEDLLFKYHKVNLIVGPTGSGKTSMLYALLGEMHFIPLRSGSRFNLPREGGVAYAAQESWVQNETIKSNILFGTRMDEERYEKVLYQCALLPDLALFAARDETEVGEKGQTLSGGQKARITLARAIYSRAEILLLDDILAALDVHTAKWIVEKCLKGDLVRGRTVLLATHNVALISPIASFVVSLGLDGRVVSQGSMDDALENNATLMKMVERDDPAEKLEGQLSQISKIPAIDSVAGKLVVPEEVSQGHVRWPALKLYLSGLGGWWLWIAVLGGTLLTSVIRTLQTWYLGYWAKQYEINLPSEVSVLKYLGGYSLLLLSYLLIWLTAFTIYYLGCIRASRSIYSRLTRSILGTTLRWLDTVPTSRVIARCTQDISAVDGPVSDQLAYVVDIVIFMITCLAAIVLITPIFLLPGLLVAAAGGWCGQVYMAGQLAVKREMSNARSPVLGHFGAAISGLTSLRAYGAQNNFRKESMIRVDKYIRASRTFYNLNRWISVRSQVLGAFFASTLAAYLIYGRGISDASSIGFSLNMAVGFSNTILFVVRLLNDFEVQGNSLERIQDYIDIEQEPKPTESGKPPAYWPSSGNITVENLSARYSSDGPEVLHELSFTIRSGEHIGIVGRTGSGKSTLTLSLLRCIFTTGSVYYDGIRTSDLNLESLRSNITVIPQQPELLRGTLRQNLDPFNQFGDAELNDALRSAGLFSLQVEGGEANITLDSDVSSGGGNLSVGQRQILALARALVRRSKLLILDEATSAIDNETDNIIQSSIRRELKDVTLIIVAHRLQTIMDADRIMVLDAGHLVEYDTPANLLKKPKSLLFSLVNESGEKDRLYQMAGVKV